MTEHDYHQLAPQEVARHLAEHHPGVVPMPYVAAAAYILSHKIDVDADVWNRARVEEGSKDLITIATHERAHEPPYQPQRLIHAWFTQNRERMETELERRDKLAGFEVDPDMRLPGGYLSYVGLLMDVLAVAAFDPRESGRIIGLLERGLASLEAADPEEVRDYYEAVYSVEMAKDDGDEGGGPS
jgi:hypothetical protein